MGSDSYAEQNGSYGLATMLKQHVRLERDQLVFDYEGKAGGAGCRRSPILPSGRRWPSASAGATEASGRAAWPEAVEHPRIDVETAVLDLLT